MLFAKATVQDDETVQTLLATLTNAMENSLEMPVLYVDTLQRLQLSVDGDDVYSREKSHG